MPSPPADWQLPPGVSRGLWAYLHSDAIARSYDEALAGSPLLTVDLHFAERHFVGPGRLIDLGCGTGRLLLPFARRGFEVLGVDLSAEMLRVAAAKAAREGLNVPLLRANLVALECLANGSFDYAACLFSTLGMITGPDERRRVLEHVHRLLRPGGAFVLHVHNRWFNAWDRSGRRWLLKDFFRSWIGSKMGGDREMPAYQGISGMALHHFTRREVLRQVRRAGFQVREIQPVSLRTNCRLRAPLWFGWLRAYGYLIASYRD